MFYPDIPLMINNRFFAQLRHDENRALSAICSGTCHLLFMKAHQPSPDKHASPVDASDDRGADDHYIRD
jgi:hypothetical protein